MKNNGQIRASLWLDWVMAGLGYGWIGLWLD